VRLQAIEYLNISGLVIDFATSPVRTGNSFFGSMPSDFSHLVFWYVVATFMAHRKHS